MTALAESPVAVVDMSTLLSALTAFKRGNFSVRLPLEWTGVAGKVADTFNEVIDLNERLARELERLGRVVGQQGKISHRASLGDVGGCWMDSVSSVNALIDDLVHPKKVFDQRHHHDDDALSDRRADRRLGIRDHKEDEQLIHWSGDGRDFRLKGMARDRATQQSKK